MFNSNDYCEIIEEPETKEADYSKALVTIKTQEFIVETHKQNDCLYGAILKCDSFSMEAKNNTLILKFVFNIIGGRVMIEALDIVREVLSKHYDTVTTNNAMININAQLKGDKLYRQKMCNYSEEEKLAINISLIRCFFNDTKISRNFKKMFIENFNDEVFKRTNF